MDETPWKRVKGEWREIVLVCRKCSKKLDGGFGPDGEEALAKALRRSLDPGRKAKPHRRAVAIFEVGCLDICPKKAVVVVKGSDPRALVLVPRGTEMAELASRLGLTGGTAPA